MIKNRNIADDAMIAASKIDGFDPTMNGKAFYVNNIVGSDSNDGLSWAKPLATISAAVTLAEAHRVLQVANNRFVQNRIYIQGTATAYTALAALPNWCDIIGVGSDPRGNGTGIARIGADTGTGGGVADAVAGGYRGLNFYNLQFQGGSAAAAFSVVQLFRSTFENCAFMVNGGSTAGLTGLVVTSKAGGLVIKNCHWGTNGSGDFATGIHLDGTYWMNCKVENCHIVGTTIGILVDSTCTYGWSSEFKNNYIGAGVTTCDVCVDDNTTTGNIMFIGNYLNGTAGSAMTETGVGNVRFIGNYALAALKAAQAA